MYLARHTPYMDGYVLIGTSSSTHTYNVQAQARMYYIATQLFIT